MESKSYVCVKCGRECFFCLHGRKEIAEQLCSECYSGAREQKEPFNSAQLNDIPDGVRKVAPKYFSNITDLIRDEARKRAMRNECNGIYKRSADVDVPACAVCAGEMEAGYSLKTATGQLICVSCHYKLYNKCEDTNAQVEVEARYDLIPQSALRAIALVMGKGAIDHNGDDWHTETDFAENMNRAAQHWNLALLGDTEHEASVRDHLSHCIARMMMAYETYKEDSE